VAVTQLLVLAAVYALAEIFPVGAVAQSAWLEAWVAVLADRHVAVIPGMGIGLKIGLLLAAATYFWRDMGDMGQGLVRMAKGKRDPGARLFFQLIVASLPMIAAVLGARHLEAVPWNTPLILVWSAVVGGVLLLLFDRACMTVKRIEHAGYGDALLLGAVQALSIVPGVGRIAIVIAMARALGYERRDAARFAFLISIPTLFAAIAWNVWNHVATGMVFPTNAVLLTALMSWIVGVICLSMLMGWLRRSTFTPFAIYRLIIGVNLLAFTYGWLYRP
jgi:undecaprenyl-diphosphatase